MTTPSGKEHPLEDRIGALATELKLLGTQQVRVYPENSPFWVRSMMVRCACPFFPRLGRRWECRQRLRNARISPELSIGTEAAISANLSARPPHRDGKFPSASSDASRDQPLTPGRVHRLAAPVNTQLPINTGGVLPHGFRGDE